MSDPKLRRVAGAVIAAALIGCLAVAPAAGEEEVVTKTYLQGVGSPTGGTALPIPDGAGPLTQLVRSPINVKGLNPRGKIRHVNVGVRPATRRPRTSSSTSPRRGGDQPLIGQRWRRQQLRRQLRQLRRPVHPVRQRLAHPDQHRGPAGALRRDLRSRGGLKLLDGLGNKKATNATWSLLVEDDDSNNPVGTLWCWKLVISATNPQ